MTVHYDVVGRRATVRLDRPDVLNALDHPTLDALAHRMRQAAVDDRVGVVVLTGTGERAFCTGADLAEQAAFLERPNDYWGWMGHFIAAVDAIRTCPKPVVARLNGMTVGGGNELNLACDLAVAADDVVFRHVGPSRGSVPAGGATQWLPLLIGDRRAREVLLLNQPIDARQALEWGWINQVVPRAELDRAVDALCEELLAKLPEVVRATKTQLDFWRDLSWSLTIRHAREWLTLHAASDEVREGLDSFREKRAPDYEGLRSRLAPPASAADAVHDEADARAQAGGPTGHVGSPTGQVEGPAGHDHPVAHPGPCPFCGRGPLAPDVVFCGYCGKPLWGA